MALPRSKYVREFRDKKGYITASAGASGAHSCMASTQSLAAISPTAKHGCSIGYGILRLFSLLKSARMLSLGTNKNHKQRINNGINNGCPCLHPHAYLHAYPKQWVSMLN